MNPKEQPDKEGDEINPETGKSYFDGLDPAKLTRPAPTEKENWPGGEDKQDELWRECISIISGWLRNKEDKKSTIGLIDKLERKFTIKNV